MNSGYLCGLSFDTQRQRQIEKKSGYIMQDMLVVFESQEQFCSRVTFNIFFKGTNSSYYFAVEGIKQYVNEDFENNSTKVLKSVSNDPICVRKLARHRLK